LADRSWEFVFLARHGQTEWNRVRRRQGQLDSPLTAAGIAQAHRGAATLRGHGVDYVFSSPLGRATATARIFADHTEAPLLVIDELAEVHHGRFAGLTDDDIDAAYPGELARRAQDKYRWTFPAGESYADADRRAARALARIAAHPARRPLIVSHEMIGRMLQRHLLGLDPAEALRRRHPHDAVYAINPAEHTWRELRTR
jgi:probable phosphoglycerate mutase